MVERLRKKSSGYWRFVVDLGKFHVMDFETVKLKCYFCLFAVGRSAVWGNNWILGESWWIIHGSGTEECQGEYMEEGNSCIDGSWV